MRMKHKVETEGMERVKPGSYHFEIVKIEDTIFEKSGDPATKVNLIVRAGTNESEVNKVHVETLGHYDKNEIREKLNQSQISLFAIKAGITFNTKNGDDTIVQQMVSASKDALDAAVATGEEVIFNWDEAAGRAIVCEIEASYSKDEPDKKSKKYSSVAQAKIFAMDDPRVADVPKDARALELAAAGEVF